MNNIRLRFPVTAFVLLFSGALAICQTVIPDVLDKGTIKEQMSYIEEKTRIYENYRAIREDMFQKIKGNIIDTLTLSKSRITSFTELTGSLNSKIDSLKNSLNTIREELKETTRTKNKISVLGIGLNKTTYNTAMWIIVAVLVFLLATGYLAFKRNWVATVRTKKELNELRTEFEEYRQKARLEREKMSMDHFKEVQKLKGR